MRSITSSSTARPDRARLRLPRRTAPAVPAYRRGEALTIRWATPGDESRLRRLADLDEAPVPSPPLLLGLVGHELWVAASVSSGAVIADPFRRSAEVARLVLERGRQLTVPAPRHARAAWLGAPSRLGASPGGRTRPWAKQEAS